MSSGNRYRHTQRAPLYLLLYLIGLLMGGIGIGLGLDPPWVGPILLTAGIFMLAIAASFHWLRTEDQGDHLEVRFGPLPIFRKTIRYQDIQDVQLDRTTILDGWGIHMSARGGWVWNLWGRDCVLIQHGGVTRVGTDDPQGLAEFLRTVASADGASGSLGN